MVYAERIAPIAAHLALIIFMFIPSVQYSLDTDKRKIFSLWGLLGNVWNESRRYLFSASTERTSEGELFYQAVFASLIVLFVLFLIGLAVSVWSSTVCLMYYKEKKPSEDAENAKNIFTTVIPNRFVLSLLRLTVIPLLFFPDLLVQLYRRLLLYNVSVSFTSIHYGLIAVLLFAAVTVITALSSKYEKRLGMDIFAKTEARKHDAFFEEYEDSTDNSEPRELRRMKSSSAEEQTERIRELLGFSEDDKNEK